MKTSILLILLIATLAMPKASQADEFAATACPPMSIAQDSSAPPNLAKNPDFDNCSSGLVSCIPGNCPSLASAAAGWRMHLNSDPSAKITTACVIPSNAPKGGQKMLRVTANGNEGGVVQDIIPSVVSQK